MAVGAPSGNRPRRASERLEVAAEVALPPLLRALAGDPLRAILALFGRITDLTCKLCRSTVLSKAVYGRCAPSSLCAPGRAAARLVQI
ncbi:hypothetical protein T492DRAFT_857838 [Pavlovales sp. CCMP2436]|nr:hypothetical protein T492DRAFT_857838 [Pavlovales sp. CCMP2436]